MLSSNLPSALFSPSQGQEHNFEVSDCSTSIHSSLGVIHNSYIMLYISILPGVLRRVPFCRHSDFLFWLCNVCCLICFFFLLLAKLRKEFICNGKPSGLAQRHQGWRLLMETPLIYCNPWFVLDYRNSYNKNYLDQWWTSLTRGSGSAATTWSELALVPSDSTQHTPSPAPVTTIIDEAQRHGLSEFDDHFADVLQGWPTD